MKQEILGPILAGNEVCTGCGACRVVCPRGALSMVADAEGFLRPQCDLSKCVGCHLCEKVCPGLHPGVADVLPECFVARAKDDVVRAKSTSGGLFSLFARAMFARGGVVYGCAWERVDGRLVAVHRRVADEMGLATLRGSKYVQSDLRETFTEVKADVAAGRPVLYSGTPCQIAGLRAVLGAQAQKVLLVEVLCHGAPSPGLITRQQDELAIAAGKAVEAVNFRVKGPSWRESCTVVTYVDGERRLTPFTVFPYMKAMLREMSLRPSCYACVAREGRSGADVTLADGWGIEKFYPQWDDDRGVSAVLLHSAQGRAFWEACRAEAEVRPLDIEEMVDGNPAYRVSPQRPRFRARFMRMFREGRLTLEEMVARFPREGALRRALRKFFTSPMRKVQRARKKRILQAAAERRMAR